MNLFKSEKTYTVMFVCSGNSCRSPMAAGLLQKKLYPEFNDRIRIISSGTLGIDDNPATLNAITVTKEKGVDISRHRSRGVRAKDLAKSDIIFVMAEHHKEFLDMHFPRYKENVFLLKTFSTGTEKPQNTSIEDPIGGDLKFYRKTINEIDKELDRILPQLLTLINYKLSNKN